MNRRKHHKSRRIMATKVAGRDLEKQKGVKRIRKRSGRDNGLKNKRNITTHLSPPSTVGEDEELIGTCFSRSQNRRRRRREVESRGERRRWENPRWLQPLPSPSPIWPEIEETRRHRKNTSRRRWRRRERNRK